MADDALSSEDYRALYGMLTSQDQAARAQGQDLAKKLTPQEGQAFFDYQKQATAGAGERTRQDNSVLGMPPELAATGIAGVGSALAQPAATLGTRLWAGTKAAVAQAAPAVKYQVTKSGLEAIGMPATVAMPVALAVSGYRSGKSPIPAAAEPAAAQAVAADVPKPRFAALDVMRIQKMMQQGATQQEAVDAIMKLRGR